LPKVFAAAVILSVLVPLLELVTVSSTGLYGFLMNFLGTAMFAVTASLIYKYRKSFFGAIVGLVSGVAAMVATMMLFNLLVTPFYMGVTVDVVQRAGILPRSTHPFHMDLRTVIVMAVALVLVVASLIVVFAVLGGRLELGF
jgi:riboflavin transporter FmnP